MFTFVSGCIFGSILTYYYPKIKEHNVKKPMAEYTELDKLVKRYTTKEAC